MRSIAPLEAAVTDEESSAASGCVEEGAEDEEEGGGGGGGKGELTRVCRPSLVVRAAMMTGQVASMWGGWREVMMAHSTVYPSAKANVTYSVKVR